jgi:YD repeat-containing protein
MSSSRVTRTSRWASLLEDLVARRRTLGGARRRANAWCLAFFLLLSLAQLFAAAVAWADIRYFYDSLGRLVRVLRDDGESATYYYDAVGNLLRITRESGAPQSTIVTSASPTTGGRDSTVALTITGDNLAGATLSSANPGITFTNVRAGINQITADLGIALSAPLGPTTLTVRGLLGSVPIAFAVTVGAPRITSFTPLLGPGGTLVTILGSQFDSQSPANNQVTFNGASAAVQSATETTLVATVPASATSGPITVTTAAGSATSAAAFITGQVVIGAVAPETGQRGASLTLTVTGSDLVGASLSRPGMTVNTLTPTAGQITASVSGG